MEKKPIETFADNENGIEVRIFKGSKEGTFNVVLFDVDANETFPTARIFSSFEAAVETAKNIAAGRGNMNFTF